MGSGDKFNTEGIQSHPGQEGENGGGGGGTGGGNNSYMYTVHCSCFIQKQE